MSFLFKNVGFGVEFLGVINGREKGFVFLRAFLSSGYVLPLLVL